MPRKLALATSTATIVPPNAANAAKLAAAIKAAPRKTTASKPATKPVSATPTKPVNVNVAAPAKPATTGKAAKPVATVPAAKPDKPAKATDGQPRGLTRDAATIVADRTNFNQYSDRDNAYLAFYGNVMRRNGHAATLMQLHTAGSDHGEPTSRKRYNPNYTGSAKATDAGAINRLCRDGYLTKHDNGFTLRATDKARSSKAYTG